MSSIIYVDHLGKQGVVIPSKNSFYRRFAFSSDWTNITIVAVIAATDLIVSNGTPANEFITSALASNKFHFGIRNFGDQDKLPGTSQVHFAGIVSTTGCNIGPDSGFSAIDQNVKFQACNDTTVVTGGTANIIHLTSGGAYTAYAYQGLNLVKDLSLNKIKLKRANNYTYVTADLSPLNLLSLIPNRLGAEIILDFNYGIASPLDTFFLYSPLLNTRLKIMSMAIQRNA